MKPEITVWIHNVVTQQKHPNFGMKRVCIHEGTQWGKAPNDWFSIRECDEPALLSMLSRIARGTVERQGPGTTNEPFTITEAFG